MLLVSTLLYNGFALALDLEKIRTPDGFSIELWVKDIPGARQMALGGNGTLFVGTRKAGRVYAVTDTDKDGQPDRVSVLMDGLNSPSGVAFKEGDLYIAEVHRILRLADVESSLSNPEGPEVIFEDLPDDAHHGWKYIDFGPDDQLYIPVGVPCNVCLPDPEYGRIFRLDINTGKTENIALGVRNSVGFDWHPETGELWFTDNGRDWMGDDLPPDELNHVTKAGQHFGFPYFHGGDVRDPRYGNGKEPASFRAPEMRFGAHVAPLGMHFYRGDMFPEKYKNAIFIAQHGSWNRSKKVGYRVNIVMLDGNRAVSNEPFATGWLQGERAWGRPVAFLELPDGSLLLSDDAAGVIYRITYNDQQSGDILTLRMHNAPFNERNPQYRRVPVGFPVGRHR